jgi:NAD(P)-dependent dehydrogenase (short-subunit alcohol dehydrogenase family)
MLAKRGATLALSDINKEKLDAALESLGPGKHIVSVVDVSNSKQVNEWIDDAAKKLGKLDGAANIAGVCRHPAPIVDETDENWDVTMGMHSKAVGPAPMLTLAQALMRKVSLTACEHS